MYIAIVATDKNRIAKFKEFTTKVEADAHIDYCKEFGFDSGFAVEAPKSGSIDYWVVDEKAKTITHDAITETADQAKLANTQYQRDRKEEYDKLNQFEMQFDDQRDGTTTWVDKINEIKGRFPKP